MFHAPLHITKHFLMSIISDIIYYLKWYFICSVFLLLLLLFVYRIECIFWIPKRPFQLRRKRDGKWHQLRSILDNGSCFLYRLLMLLLTYEHFWLTHFISHKQTEHIDKGQSLSYDALFFPLFEILKWTKEESKNGFYQINSQHNSNEWYIFILLYCTDIIMCVPYVMWMNRSIYSMTFEVKHWNALLELYLLFADIYSVLSERESESIFNQSHSEFNWNMMCIVHAHMWKWAVNNGYGIKEKKWDRMEKNNKTLWRWLLWHCDCLNVVKMTKIENSFGKICVYCWLLLLVRRMNVRWHWIG